MTLGPYRVDAPSEGRKRHLYPAEMGEGRPTAACGREAVESQTLLVSRAELVRADLDGHVCKRCLYIRNLISEHGATIATQI